MTESSEDKKEFGIIGLGQIGASLAQTGLKKGLRVVGIPQPLTPKPLLELGLREITNVEEFVMLLKPPRVIFLDIPTGAGVDQRLEELASFLEEEDVVVESSLSYWGDSLRRFQKLRERNLEFVDLGVTGRLGNQLQQSYLLAGGTAVAFNHIRPILQRLVQDRIVHAGPAGSGHFCRMVYHGIELCLLQAMQEGLVLLSRYNHLDFNKIVETWKKSSIGSATLQLMCQENRPEVIQENIKHYIEEMNWLVGDALKMEIPIPEISHSLMQFFTAADKKNQGKPGPMATPWEQRPDG